jgi:PHD/YefM family antitoxin component YafN of YafNO toxin-antitoxin module
MQEFSATSAKQNFGALLKAAALSPVAIKSHQRQQAIVLSPAQFAQLSQSAGAALAGARQLARAQQAVVERDRLLRHQRIALDVLTLAPRARAALLAQAQTEVARWRSEQLCHPDYADRWQAILALPLPELALALAAHHDGWGPALRQNSPFVGLQA